MKLQETIEQIIIDNTYPAQEIAEHMKAFNTWLLLDILKAGFEPPDEFNTEIVWHRYDQDKDYTYDDVYEFWFENIYKK